MKKLAAYWDWKAGANVPEARLVVCSPGLYDTIDGCKMASTGVLMEASMRGTRFVVTATDWAPWKDGASLTTLLPALHVTRQADLARLPDLLAVKAEKRALVVSPEEALRLTDGPARPDIPYGMTCGLDVDVVFIVGLDKPVHPDWVRSIVDQCQAAGVPVVFVTWGTWAPAAHLAERYPNDPVGARFEHGEWFWRVNAERFGALLDGKPIEDVPAWLGGEHG